MLKNLFRNLFKISTQPLITAPDAHVPTAAEIEGEKRLKEANLKLDKLQADYAQGAFSGHPEEMLESIEDLQEVIHSLHRAQKRGWRPDAKVISHIKEEMENQKTHMIKLDCSKLAIDSEMAHRQRHLDEAIAGLR